MFEFEKLCRAYESLCYEERLEALKRETGKIMPVLSSMPYGREMIMLLSCASMAADGKLQGEEYLLFREAVGFDFSYSEVEYLMKQLKRSSVQEAADQIVDSLGMLSEDIKASLCSFCLLLCSSDGKVTLKERSFIRKLVR